jgi:hypothetical protein
MTGTGKTVTLQILAEGFFSAAGVPFLSDIMTFGLAEVARPTSCTARSPSGHHRVRPAVTPSGDVLGPSERRSSGAGHGRRDGAVSCRRWS